MIVDSHVHIFPPEMIARRGELAAADATFSEMYSDPAARMATADELVASMDEDGVDISVAMGIGWADPGLARESNDYIAEAARRHPGRIVGFGSVNPAREGTVAEIDRCAAMGLRGIGELHPDTQGFDPSDSAVMTPILEALGRRDMSLTVHCSEPVGHMYPGKGRTTPDKLAGLVAISSGVRIILAHWGGGLPLYALMPEVRRSLSSVYFDTAASPFLYDHRIFEVVTSLVGSDRVLGASDYPLMRHSAIRKQVVSTGLSKSDRLAVLGGNAARALDLAEVSRFP